MKNLAYILIVSYTACSLSLSAELSESEKEAKKEKGTVTISDISSFGEVEKEKVNREGLQRAKQTVDQGKISEKTEAPPPSLNISGPQWGLRAVEIEYLFAHSRDLVCLIDFGGHFKRINKRWTEVLGWTEEELLKEPYIKFVHPEDVQQTLAYERDFTPIGLINRYRCKDGSYRCLDWIGISQIRESEKESSKAYPLTIARDITLQKFLSGIFGNQSSSTKTYQFFNQRVLESIVEVQSVHTKNMYEKEQEKIDTFKLALRNAINLTESACGFIVEVLHSREMKSFLYYNWEAGPLSSGEIGDFLKRESPEPRFAVFSSLLEKILSTKKWLILNDLRSNESAIDSRLAPTSYKNFVGIPLITRDEVVGIIGLVNRDGGYNEDILTLMNPLFQIVAQVMDLVRTAR